MVTDVSLPTIGTCTCGWVLADHIPGHVNLPAHDQGAMVKFAVGPFSVPYSLPASNFQSLSPLPRLLGMRLVGAVVQCPEIDGQVWRMFVSWVYDRNYTVPEPGKKHSLLV